MRLESILDFRCSTLWFYSFCPFLFVLKWFECFIVDNLGEEQAFEHHWAYSEHFSGVSSFLAICNPLHEFHQRIFNDVVHGQSYPDPFLQTPYHLIETVYSKEQPRVSNAHWECKSCNQENKHTPKVIPFLLFFLRWCWIAIAGIVEPHSKGHAHCARRMPAWIPILIWAVKGLNFGAHPEWPGLMVCQFEQSTNYYKCRDHGQIVKTTASLLYVCVGQQKWCKFGAPETIVWVMVPGILLKIRGIFL